MPSCLASICWNSWDTFRYKVSESVIHQTANILISMGLKDHDDHCIIVGNPQTIHAVKNP